MVEVRSRITLPDGKAAASVRVNLRVLASPTWHADRTGMTLGRSTVWTGEDGWWSCDLLPYTAYEDHDDVFVEAIELGPAGTRCVSYMRVPNAAGPLLMRDILINPPPAPNGCWRPINQLGDLFNVDPDANQPPEGSALVVADGVWMPGQAGASKLAALGDVDAESVAAAKVGQPLIYLGSEKGWGVETDVSTGLVFLLSDPGAAVDPDGWTVRLELIERSPGESVTVDWGDLSQATELGGDTNHADHAYPNRAADYFVSVVYTGSGDPGEPEDGNDNPHLPFPRSREDA